MYPAAAINVTPAPGVSSGQAIDKTEELVRGKILRSMRHEWTELALLQLQTGNTAMYVFILAVVLVFLVLAAQYESWSLPLAVILGVVPLVISEGAGAEMRRTLGTAVFAGMLGVTLFGIFLTPVFFYVIQWVSDWRAQAQEAAPEANAGRPPRTDHLP